MSCEKEKCGCLIENRLRHPMLRMLFYAKTWNSMAEPSVFATNAPPNEWGWLAVRVAYMDELYFEMKRWADFCVDFSRSATNIRGVAFFEEALAIVEGIGRKLEDAAVSTFGETLSHVFVKDLREQVRRTKGLPLVVIDGD
jgi:hypothetical protein